MKITHESDTRDIEKAFIKKVRELIDIKEAAMTRLDMLTDGKIDSTWGEGREVSYLLKLVNDMFPDD